MLLVYLHCTFLVASVIFSNLFLYWQYLTRKLLNQGFLLFKLKSSLRKFPVATNDLVDRYGISASQITTDMFHLLEIFPGSFLIHSLSPGL